MGSIVTYAPGDRGLGRAYDPIGAPDRLPDLRAAGVASARICRYGGHVLTSARRPWMLLQPGDPADNRLGDGLYSVAQHQLIMSYVLPPELSLEGLTHDLTEGLGMFDLQAPIKAELPGYRTIEDGVGREVNHRLEIIPSAMVKIWDKNLVWTERRDLHGATDFSWEQPAGTFLLPLRIRPMTPLAAARAWLDRYEKLRRGDHDPGPARARYNRLRYTLGIRTMYTGIELWGLRTPGESRTWPRPAWRWGN